MIRGRRRGRRDRHHVGGERGDVAVGRFGGDAVAVGVGTGELAPGVLEGRRVGGGIGAVGGDGPFELQPEVHAQAAADEVLQRRVASLPAEGLHHDDALAGVVADGVFEAADVAVGRDGDLGEAHRVAVQRGDAQLAGLRRVFFFGGGAQVVERGVERGADLGGDRLA